jgi:transaldolase|tara:strand:- start:659 stop:1330 length:672 start_codon:yes stop_codon:yes gene_type:complete
MKIFLDTADTELIKKYYGTGLIDGVTTNPTLIRKSGRDPEDVYQELADYGVRDISMEVVGDEKTMTEEGRRLHSKYAFQSKKLSINPTTIKVPLSPDGLRTCRSLALDGIKVNVTLVFSAAQAILASKAGAAYVSPFVGRLDDQSVNGIGLINQIASIYRMHGSQTQVLSASIRSVQHVSDSFLNGANICTMPPSIFEKMYNHILTDKGLDLFDRDWALVQSK